MIYEEYIDSLRTVAATCKKVSCSDPSYVCYHIHHIIPKCFGGTNSKDNLIMLTCEEHIKAHILLCEKYQQNEDKYYKMLCALLRLVSGFKSVDELKLDKIDIQKQAQLLQERALLNSKRTKGIKRKYHSPFDGLSEDEAKELHRKWSLRLKGRKRSEEVKKHMSEAQKNNPKNPMVKAAKEGRNFFRGKHHSKESREKMSKAQKGRSVYEGCSKEEAERRYKARCERNRKENNPCYGKKRYVCIATGKQCVSLTHPGEGYVTTAEWAKMKHSI